MRSTISLPKTQEIQDELSRKYLEAMPDARVSSKVTNLPSVKEDFISSTLDIFWSGYWDEPEEGVFTAIMTGEKLDPNGFSAWRAGEPNGERIENCLGVWPLRNQWNDVSCFHTPNQVFCEFERAPYLQIRGIFTHYMSCPIALILWGLYLRLVFQI